MKKKKNYQVIFQLYKTGCCYGKLLKKGTFMKETSAMTGLSTIFTQFMGYLASWGGFQLSVESNFTIDLVDLLKKLRTTFPCLVPAIRIC